MSPRLGLVRRRVQGLPPPDMRTCNAPTVALRLSPNGNVNACGANGSHSLGNVGESSLRAIWDGALYTEFRSALAAADYSLGCRNCGEARAQGKRSLSHAEVYDRLTETEPGGWPRRIEFGLSNTCNLQCVQCNGDLSSSIRAQREHRPPLRSPYGDAFFEELREVIPHLEMATFIGGEPFLTKEDRRVWDLMIELGARPEVHVTTNGTVWNDRVEYYLHALEMSVALSIDGVDPATQARIRVGSDLTEVRANRDRFLAATRSYGGDFTLNHCMMPQNWREFMPFLLEADELGVLVLNARVLGPHEFSLYSLPARQLAGVIDGLERQAAVDAARLTTNRGVWDETLEDLTTHLRLIERHSVGVALPSRPAPPDDLAPHVAALTSSDGTPPLHVVMVDDRITAVTAPPWAARLALEDSIGDVGVVVMAALVDVIGPELIRSDPQNDARFQHHTYRVGSTEVSSIVITTPARVDGAAERIDILIGEIPMVS